MNEHLLFPLKYNSSKDVSEFLGGKGKNLFWLKENGIKTADFFVLSSKAYESYQKNTDFLDSLTLQIQNSLLKIPSEFYAVRSSVNLEDGNTNSFAGIFDTFLYVSKEDINLKIKECFDSVNSPRVKAYLDSSKLKIDLTKLKMSVVIQKMVTPISSGITFTRSPVGHSSFFQIDSSFGLGEGIVSGVVSTDSYTLDRFGKTIKKHISQKNESLHFNPKTKLVESIKNQLEISSKPSLKDEQIKAIYTQGIQLEKLYKSPCDFEWSFDKDGTLIILQIRPITKAFNNLQYFVDTNLSESYPNVCSPLTNFLIPKLYEKAFKEVLKKNNLNLKTTQILNKHYESLITSFDHHLYYNLSSYYTVLCALPGGSKNIDNWHLMIGGQLELLDVNYDKFKLTKYDNFKIMKTLFTQLINKNKLLRTFCDNSDNVIKDWRKNISNLKSTQDLGKFIDHMIEKTNGFGLTLINDIHIMILLKLFIKLNPNIKDGQLPNYLTTSANIKSVEPLIELEKLYNLLDNFNEFVKYIDENTSEFTTFEDLKILVKGNEQYNQNLNNCLIYLENYGDRSFEELKFECLNFNQSPFEFIKLLKWFTPTQSKLKDKSSKESQYKSLSIFSKLVLKKLHSTIEWREETRFYRGRYYSLIKEAFIRSIHLLRRDEIFKQLSLKDFFTIDQRDLQYKSNQEIFDKIESQKNWSINSTKHPEFYCDDGSKHYFHELNENLDLDSENIKGIGVCEGIIDGIALNLATPHEAFDIDKDILNNSILITKTTDPAWVFLMSQCKGLISEKGSLLSHTAIIGRELNIPTIVSCQNITNIIQTGQNIQINGKSGEVLIN
jgi:pyruvate,water dikinase